jgi:hypothetical protein
VLYPLSYEGVTAGSLPAEVVLPASAKADVLAILSKLSRKSACGASVRR